MMFSKRFMDKSLNSWGAETISLSEIFPGVSFMGNIPDEDMFGMMEFQ